jgi:hypothetical protein
VSVECKKIITKEIWRGKAKANREVMDSDEQVVRNVLNTQLFFRQWVRIKNFSRID